MNTQTKLTLAEKLKTFTNLSPSAVPLQLNTNTSAHVSPSANTNSDSSPDSSTSELTSSLQTFTFQKQFSFLNSPSPLSTCSSPSFSEPQGIVSPSYSLRWMSQLNISNDDCYTKKHTHSQAVSDLSFLRDEPPALNLEFLFQVPVLSKQNYLYFQKCYLNSTWYPYRTPLSPKRVYQMQTELYKDGTVHFSKAQAQPLSSSPASKPKQEEFPKALFCEWLDINRPFRFIPGTSFQVIEYFQLPPKMTSPQTPLTPSSSSQAQAENSPAPSPLVVIPVEEKDTSFSVVNHVIKLEHGDKVPFCFPFQMSDKGYLSIRNSLMEAPVAFHPSSSSSSSSETNREKVPRKFVMCIKVTIKAKDTKKEKGILDHIPLFTETRLDQISSFFQKDPRFPLAFSSTGKIKKKMLKNPEFVPIQPQHPRWPTQEMAEDYETHFQMQIKPLDHSEFFHGTLVCGQQEPKKAIPAPHSHEGRQLSRRIMSAFIAATLKKQIEFFETKDSRDNRIQVVNKQAQFAPFYLHKSIGNYQESKSVHDFAYPFSMMDGLSPVSRGLVQFQAQQFKDAFPAHVHIRRVGKVLSVLKDSKVNPILAERYDITTEAKLDSSGNEIKLVVAPRIKRKGRLKTRNGLSFQHRQVVSMKGSFLALTQDGHQVNWVETFTKEIGQLVLNDLEKKNPKKTCFMTKSKTPVWKHEVFVDDKQLCFGPNKTWKAENMN